MRILRTGFGNECSYMAKRRLKEILTEMLFPQNSPPSLPEIKEVSLCTQLLIVNFQLCSMSGSRTFVSICHLRMVIIISVG